MLLVIDIGNSSVSCGVFEVDSVKNTYMLRYDFRITTKVMSSDEYALLINNFLSIKNISASPASAYSSSMCDVHDGAIVDHAAVASVVPELTDTLVRAAELLTGNKPFVVGSGIRTGLGIRINSPQQLGADIVANAAFAVDTAKAPLVILDVGTATTITVVDPDKNVLGTIIMPGLRVSLAALSGSAAQLNDVALTFPRELIGRDSAESVQSGVLCGHVLMIDGFLRNIREQYPALTASDKLSLLSTGGLAEYIVSHLRNKFDNHPSMTLYGIAKLYMLNTGRMQ